MNQDISRNDIDELHRKVNNLKVLTSNSYAGAFYVQLTMLWATLYKYYNNISKDSCVLCGLHLHFTHEVPFSPLQWRHMVAMVTDDLTATFSANNKQTYPNCVSLSLCEKNLQSQILFTKGEAFLCHVVIMTHLRVIVDETVDSGDEPIRGDQRRSAVVKRPQL